MSWDVIVVGAGPSGSTVARICAQYGLKTLVLEKSRLPRDKLCGGAVSETALSLLGFPIERSLIERECYDSRVYYGHKYVEVRDENRIAILTNRREFDYFLMQKAIQAGAEAKDGERITSVEVSSKEAVVRSKKNVYSADIIVGADGVNSVVSRLVRPRFGPKGYLMAMQEDIPCDNNTLSKYGDAIHIYLDTIYRGYGWIFPKADRLSVGVGGPGVYSRVMPSIFTRFLRRHGIAYTGKPKGHLLPAGGYGQKRLCSDRILLTGDAAGFVDVFSGEGIRYAIWSGKEASSVICDCIDRGTLARHHLAVYERRCERLFISNLRTALILTKMVHICPGWFFKAGLLDKKVFEKYIEVTRQHISYRHFIAWFITRLPWVLGNGFIHPRRLLN